MRHAKIVCTLGPASSSDQTISRMISEGMDVVRLNFSHGTHQEHGEQILRIRRIAESLSRPVAILQDLEGPRIRIGMVEGKSVMLKVSDPFILTSREIRGNQEGVSMSYPELSHLVQAGDPILLNDGTVELRVEKTTPSDVHCRVVTGGRISSRKGINLPTRSIAIAAFTQKDQRDLEFGIKSGVDSIALSFVKDADDILKIKKVLERHRCDIPVIAKIERHEALDHLDSILDASDGVMVARGDLGIEIAVERVPMAQKEIIRRANGAGRPVITATQMLQSMVESLHPTRAEVNDVANAVLDGTDAVMLSEETAMGRYPVEALMIMSRIVMTTEENVSDGTSPVQEIQPEEVPKAVCRAAASAARAIGAKGIIVFTQTGNTARLISQCRPAAPILAFTPTESIRRKMALLWGVIPFRMDRLEPAENLIVEMERSLKERGWATGGDRFVILLGFPIRRKGPTNMIKLHTVE